MHIYHEDFVKVTNKLQFTEEEKSELYPLIEEILLHEKWQCMMKYKHHLDTRSIHSLEVCCRAWRVAYKSKKMNHNDIAVGALLHDFFLYDWQCKKNNFKDMDIKFKPYTIKTHGFIHPIIAYHNAEKYFPHLMNERVKDIIIKHMWPLTFTFPKHSESWLVSMIDKSCSIEVFKNPKELPLYLGIRKEEEVLLNE
jgi:uncharacterized protein